jgi:hypothetical protein
MHRSTGERRNPKNHRGYRARAEEPCPNSEASERSSCYDLESVLTRFTPRSRIAR